MSTHSQRLTLLVSMIFFCMSACIKDGNQEPGQQETEYISQGDNLPIFIVTQSDGTMVGTDNLLGNWSVIVFFNTSCGDCRQLLPVLEDFYRTTCIANDIRFICISREEGAEKTSRYWKENNLTMPYSSQDDRRVFNLFAHSGVPRVYVSDPNGVVRHVFRSAAPPTLGDLQESIK